MNYTETPTEQDFPLIDRCVVCERICDWQPRYEAANRDCDHAQHLAFERPMDYKIPHRVVKICADCAPDDNRELRRLIRKHYPVYAKHEGI